MFAKGSIYLRSVAPAKATVDAESGRTLRGISTGDIYLGSLPFVLVQVLVMALIIAFPALVIGDADKSKPKFDRAAIDVQLREMNQQREPGAEPDPMQQLLESMKRNP
ncbi:MAG: hypothetical protein Q8L49_02415 [Burkholderiaceae bacterium]|nr:hypothetical protein [Burkholderiaceae bacterium]